jgi:HSP20 family protein
MNMQVWNPFQEFENLLSRYNKGASGSGTQLSNDLNFADWAPSCDIEEEEDRYVIKADLPGVDKKDIDVKLENGIISTAKVPSAIVPNAFTELSRAVLPCPTRLKMKG